MLQQVGNLVFADVPPGGEDDYVVLETLGTPRDFAAEGFAPRDHLELGTAARRDRRGARREGVRLPVLLPDRAVGAELELALVNLAMSTAMRNGFTPMIPPALVKPSAMEGTGLPRPGGAGRLPPGRGRPLPGRHGRGAARRVPLRRDPRPRRSLPLRYAGLQPELPARGRLVRQGHPRHLPGALVRQGRDVRLLRARGRRRRAPEAAGQWEKEFITALEIPFQVLELAAGDLGLSAARKYDCYGWLPTQDRYREITSTSNCTEFQARRLNIRARFAAGTGPVATLNGTLCAMTRTIIMILENHQQADGSVRAARRRCGRSSAAERR